MSYGYFPMKTSEFSDMRNEDQQKVSFSTRYLKCSHQH